MEKWIPTAIVSFATAAALLGNLSVLVVLKYRWRSSGATKMYIMTLAALDLVCVLVSVPRELLTLGDPNNSTGSLSDCQRQTNDTAVGTLCKVGVFFTYQMTFTTALILVAISTNRLMKITGVEGEARSVLTARGAGAGGGKARRPRVKSLAVARKSLLRTVELIGKERGAKVVSWVAGIVSLVITIPVVFAYGGRSESAPTTTTTTNNNNNTTNNTGTPNDLSCVSPCRPCFETSARSLHAFYLIVFLAAGAVSLTLYGAALRLLCKDCRSGDEAEAEARKEAALVPWRRGYRRYRNECGGGGGRSRLSAVVHSHRVSCSLGTLCEARENSDLAAREGEQRRQVLRSKSEGDDAAAAFVAAAAAAAVARQEPCRRADAAAVVEADGGADAPGRASLRRASSKTATSATSTASTPSSEASSAPPKSPVGSEPTAAAACPPTSTVATRATASSPSSHSIFRSFSWNLFAGLGSLNPRPAETAKSASFRIVSGRPFSTAVSKPLSPGPRRERPAETRGLRPITTAPFYADDKGDDDHDSGDNSDDGDDVFVDAPGGQPDEKREKEKEDDVGELVATPIEWLGSVSAEPNVEFHPPVTAKYFPGSAAAVASSAASASSAVSAAGAEAAASTAFTSSSSSSPSASCVVHDAPTVSEPVACPVDYIADARASDAADATVSTQASTNGNVTDTTVSTPASTDGDDADATVSTTASTNGDVTDAAATPVSTAIPATAAVPTGTGSASLTRSVYRQSLLLPPVSYSAELMSVMNLHSDRNTNSLSRQEEFMRRQASVSSVQFSRLGTGISKQSTIVFFLATVVYFVTYLPFFAIMYKEAASSSSRREPAEDVLARLYLISHAAKPVVYFVFNSHFRSSLWKLIVCRREIL